jgi:flagellin
MNELNRNTNRLGKSLKKVSTGSKINSAADDASGYSIGEGMKKQIRALEQDQRNTQNGTSLLKVAEGAISSTVDILRTMKEKAVNAANDTNTDADRAVIQKELDQSIDQIDDNANITFNGQYLIDGSKNGQVTATRTTLTNSHLNIAATDYLTEMTDKAGDSLCIKDTDNVQLSFVVDGNTYITSFKADKVMFENIIDKANYLYSEGAINAALAEKQDKLDKAKEAKDTAVSAAQADLDLVKNDMRSYLNTGVVPAGYADAGDLSRVMAEKEDNLKKVKEEQGAIEKKKIEDAQKEYEEKTKDLLVIQANYSVTSYIGIDAGGNSVYTADGDNAVSIRANTAGIKKQLAGFTITITDNTGRVNTAANTVLDDFSESIRGENDSVDNSIVIHTGTESSQNMKLRLTNMKSEALGLRGTAGNNLSVVTQKNANAAINVFDNAIQKALDQQTSIGAMQSRLEATFNNLVTGTENTTSAQSVIQDADMAKEMTEYTKHNVLMQAAQSMLSQANQQSSGALSLLQG